MLLLDIILLMLMFTVLFSLNKAIYIYNIVDVSHSGKEFPLSPLSFSYHILWPILNDENLYFIIAQESTKETLGDVSPSSILFLPSSGCLDPV